MLTLCWHCQHLLQNFQTIVLAAYFISRGMLLDLSFSCHDLHESARVQCEKHSASLQLASKLNTETNKNSKLSISSPNPDIIPNCQHLAKIEISWVFGDPVQKLRRLIKKCNRFISGTLLWTFRINRVVGSGRTHLPKRSRGCQHLCQHLALSILSTLNFRVPEPSQPGGSPNFKPQLLLWSAQSSVARG